MQDTWDTTTQLHLINICRLIPITYQFIPEINFIIFQLQNGRWLPPPEDVIRLYVTINEQKCPELEWQCPGRRPPTPTEINHMNPCNDENMDEELVF